MSPIETTISDPHAPIRLRGRTIRAIVDEVNHKIVFECEMPEVPTQEEVEYLETSVDRVCKVLRQEFAGMVQEAATVDGKPV